MFEIISESFKNAVNKLKTIDDEKALKNALETLKKALLKADVHHKVVKDFLALVEADLRIGTIGQKPFLQSIKANLKAMPRQPKRTETLEQAREKSPAAIAGCCCGLATAASCSNDAPIHRSGLSASLDPIGIGGA